MKNLVAVLAFALLVPCLAHAFPPEQTGNCLDCHKLERKEAEDLVKQLIPGATVKEITLAPVKALWQIDVEMGGNRGSIYFDFTKRFLTTQFIPKEIALQQAAQQAKPKKTDFSKIPLKDAVVLGSKSAKKRAVVFTDPDCPFCRKLHEEMKKAVEKRKDIAFYLMLYPLPMHKDAYPKSQAVLCEKSQRLLDDAFSGKDVPAPACGNEALERILALGKSLNISGTPTLIREDGTIASGALTGDKLIEWVEGR